MNIHSAPDELIEELDRGMFVAVPLHMIPELQSFDMTHVYRDIKHNPSGLKPVEESVSERPGGKG